MYQKYILSLAQKTREDIQGILATNDLFTDYINKGFNFAKIMYKTGENMIQVSINPDTYLTFPKTLKEVSDVLKAVSSEKKSQTSLDKKLKEEEPYDLYINGIRNI